MWRVVAFVCNKSKRKERRALWDELKRDEDWKPIIKKANELKLCSLCWAFLHNLIARRKFTFDSLQHCRHNCAAACRLFLPCRRRRANECVQFFTDITLTIAEMWSWTCWAEHLRFLMRFYHTFSSRRSRKSERVRRWLNDTFPLWIVNGTCARLSID